MRCLLSCSIIWPSIIYREVLTITTDSCSLAGLMIMDNEMWNSVMFEDLRTSLNEVLNGFCHLSSFDFLIDIEREPKFVEILLDFFAALAVDDTRRKGVSVIHGYIHTKAGNMSDDYEVAVEQRQHRVQQVKSLKQAWAQLKASLEGQVREVAFSVAE